MATNELTKLMETTLKMIEQALEREVELVSDCCSAGVSEDGRCTECGEHAEEVETE